MRKISYYVCMALLLLSLTACGLSSEEITSTIDDMQNEYQSGSYDEAYAHIAKLDKAYDKMDDEQKSLYGDLREPVQYAYENAEAINERLSGIGDYIDQSLYYEAYAEMESLVSEYTLPPTEQAAYDSYKTAVDEGIRKVKVDNALNAAMTAFNNNEYDTAMEQLNSLDESAMTDEEAETRNLWINKVNALGSLISAQASYNSGNYSTAQSTLSSIDSSLLNENQAAQYQQLKQNTENALAEIKKKEEAATVSGSKAIEIVKATYTSSELQQLGYDFYYYDKGTYWLVCATATRNGDGTDKFRVYKSDGRLQYVGSGSDWEAPDSEIAY